MTTGQVKRVQFEQGEFLFLEGTQGDRAYFITNGQVTVMKRDENGKQVAVAQLGTHQLIGEMCLFDEQSVRTASIMASEPVEAIELTREQFQMEYDQLSPPMRIVFDALLRRLRENYSKIASMLS